MKRLAVLTLCVVLGGCSNPLVDMIPPDSLYPPKIMECLAPPPAPVPAPPGQHRDEKTDANYINGLYDSATDCHDRVKDMAFRKELYVQQYNAEHGSTGNGIFDKLFKPDS